ncbi:hypothetical protein CH305_18530 [Rhodococcus sp. 15-649-2-2]|nr:hypothetical protein CH305_18530 [Rhodococcus sp. 15-649-2-2]
MDFRVSNERYEELVPAWNLALIEADCTSVDRVAMFVAQIGHESGGLLHMQEIASGSAYEGRTDLGNTQPGDGKRFKGHGPIQITGRYNHTKVSEWAYSKGFVPTPTFFVDDPNALAGDEFGFLGAVWYWTVARNMNGFADRQDLLGATKAVNGGTNGLDDRRKFYYRALALGDALLPQEDDMANAADVQEQLLGPDGKGWPQLGDEFNGNKGRSLVDGIARLIQIGNFAVEQNDRIEKALARIEAKIGTQPEVK